MIEISKRRRLDTKNLISQLPDHLLHHILLKIETKDSVKTSVLSRRWRYLWKRVPGLDININYVGIKNDGLESFVDMFLAWDKKAAMYQLKLKYDYNKYSHKYKSKGLNMMKWISSVITRGVQHLVVDAYSDRFFGISNYWSLLPVSICVCDTLVHLNLDSVSFPSFELVSLPRLETLLLRYVRFPSETALERLISSSQVLRVLNIDKIDNVKVFRVWSQTLNSLRIKFWKLYMTVEDQTHYEVVIDAPRLKCLCLEYDESVSLVLNSLCSLIKLGIDSSKIETMSNFLAGMSNVKSLALSCSTLKAMYDYLRLEPLPRLANLTHLQITLHSSIPKLLLVFLACYPNLKSLDLRNRGSIDILELSNSFVPKCLLTSDSLVPKCLLTSLESVYIESRPGTKDEAETKFVEYILGNAALLKKLTLDLHCFSENDKSQATKPILMFPRRSSVCQIFVK